MTLGGILGVDLQSIIPTVCRVFCPLENLDKLTEEEIRKGL
jgi:hypothetical protein